MIDVAALHTAITRLANLAHTDFDATQMLTTLCEAARAILDVDGVGVMASDGRRTRFVDADHPDLLLPERLQENLQQGPCRESLEQESPVAVADLGDDDLLDRWPSFVPVARAAGMGSVLAMPLMARGRGWGTLDLYRRRTGTWTAPEVEAAALIADVAVSYLVLAADRDVARVQEQQLSARNLHDDLTGLPNRTLFMDRLEQALLTAHRHESAVAVLFLDLDRFKQVNDSMGHAGGDVVLTEAARRMSAVMREDDTLARLAGDEFAIVCVDLPLGATGVLNNLVAGVTNRLRAALSAPIRVDGIDLVVSASIGVAVSAGSGGGHVAALELLRQADGAMYLAKFGGRDRVHVTPHDDVAELPDRPGSPHARGSDLSGDLAVALDRREFRVHYQPIVVAGTDRVHAVEALLRWQHPRYGLLPAADFIELAIHTGRLPRIGHWLLHRACADLAGWRDQVPDAAPERVFVNLGAVQLGDSDLLPAIDRALDDSGLKPDDLGLEIVEDDLQGPDLSPTLQALSAAGHVLSIDDFGTGYSSLSRLVTLPVSVAKIDKTFVAGLPGDPRCRALVDAVLVVTHSLGLVVVAEGVDTAEQAALVTGMGCEYLQGHHESEPVAADAVLRRLRAAGRQTVHQQNGT